MDARPLDADSLTGFVQNFLLDHYEERRPIAPFHYEWWKLVTSDHPRVAIAGPRGHSKSTSLNHAYGLAAALFKRHPFQLKICKTYDLACEKLTQAKDELTRNEILAKSFRLDCFTRDREDEFVARMEDGYEFRMSASGMDQVKRGKSWGTMRPSLIQVDDGEDDEEVLNAERREKTMRTLLNVILPMGGDNTHFRVYGTVLHASSMLKRLMTMKGWRTALYEACDDEISEGSILWPQKFPRKRLLEIKQMYADAGNLIGFNMEYRNIAIDLSSGFFRPEDFIAMNDDDYKNQTNGRLTYYVGGDLAISTSKGRDRTVFGVGGLDTDGTLDIVDVRAGRWDALEIIEELFSIHETYQPDEYYIESGAILKALQGSLEIEQRRRGIYLNIVPMTPVGNKTNRAGSKERGIQARMRAKAVHFDTQTSWYADLQQEFLQFPRGEHDDHVDALAWLGIGLARMVAPPTEEEEEEADFEFRRREAMSFGPDGRSSVTGY